MRLPTEDELNLKLVPSVIHRGKRVRALYQTVLLRPPTETFSEFLWWVVGNTFGKEWVQQQDALRPEKQHVVVKWSKAVTAWLPANATDANKVKEGLWSFRPSGHAQSILQLGFDLFCLQQVNRLSEPLVNRLRNRNEFQGARYEVAVASIFARAGFDIKFCEEQPGAKICEFVATTRSGLRIAVEAKSRRRSGVLNQKGKETTEYEADFKNLYADARKKRPGMPFIIFIDLNLPPEQEIPWEKSRHFEKVKTIVGAFPEPTAERPSPDNMLVLTNYGSYFSADNAVTLGAPLYLVSQYPQYPINDPRVFPAIDRSVSRYAAFPEHV